MQTRFFKILCGVIVISALTAPSSNGEDKIQAFVTSAGKVVFTNLVDNTALPVAPAAAADAVAAEMPASLKALVDSIARAHGVDPALVRAVMKTESNFNRWAVSSKGALGLMQLIPETGRRYGVRDFFDPEQNVDGGVRHLKFLLEKFDGNIDLSLAAYNAGENLVAKLGRVPSIPETTDYVRKVRAIYRRMSASAASALSARPMMAAAISAEAADNGAGGAKDEAHRIYRSVDAHGVVYFSNIEPSN